MLISTTADKEAVLAPSIRFGHCELRPASGELIRDGVPVLLGRRALRLLMVLLDAEGELVTTGDLLRQVWGGVIVEPNTIQVHVSSLRRALGEDRRLLKTYSGRGYRLACVAERGTVPPGNPAATKSATDDSSSRSVPHNLPAPMSDLIGRDPLLEVLIPLVGQHRLLTLTGAGGIGKTRLGIEAARKSLQRFPGGVFLIDLAPISDPTFVRSALTSSIGPEPSFHTSLAERSRSLGDEGVLILLDNCEHLIDAVAESADIMLRSNAAIRLFATSREPLRVSGEEIFKVPPLGVPASDETRLDDLLGHGAVQLFIGRSLALRRQFLSDPRVASDVARICRALDGIPLAIELAAARAASLGVADVASRLHESLDLLRGGARTALLRHQTLRATFEWSYELLTLPERIVFTRLAAFSAAFSMEAACHVVADEDLHESRVIVHLADLVDKSLLSIETYASGSRYRLLETTRAFACERLAASGELDRLARRHAEFYLGALDSRAPVSHGHSEFYLSVRGYRSSSSSEAAKTSEVGWFRIELENIRAALDWAYSPSGDVGLGFALSAHVVPLMLSTFLVQECVMRGKRAIEATPQALIADPVQDLRIRTAMTSSLVYTHGPDKATVKGWSEVLSRARRSGSQAYELRALWGLWTVETFAGKPKRALRRADSYTELAGRMGNRESVVLGDRIRGIALHYAGDQAAARQHLERMISRYVHEENAAALKGLFSLFNHGIAARATLARVLWFQGHVDRSMELMEMALAEALAQDHAMTICFVLVESALPLSMLTGERQAARQYLALLMSTLQRQEFVVFQWVGRCYASLLSDDDETEFTALAQLRQAVEKLGELRFCMYSSYFTSRLAQNLIVRGLHADAAALIDRSIRSVRATHERLWKPELLRTQALLLMEARTHDALALAEACLRSARSLARDLGLLSLELRVAMTQATLATRLDRHADARSVLRQVYARFAEGHSTRDLLEAADQLRSLDRADVDA